jgi:hypothetical protein
MTRSADRILEIVSQEKITKEDYLEMQSECVGLEVDEYGLIEMVERRLGDLRLRREIDF